jgi:integrase
MLRDTKNGRPRFVPLSTRALAVLEGLPEVGSLFPFSNSWLRQTWRQTCRDARIEGLRWHDLRHEAISRMAEKGLDMLELMAISGHRTPIMLARYAHLRVSRLAAKLG